MAPPVLGRRICVYGPSGSGKTTLGRLLAGRLGLPFVELDAIFHSRPDWKDLSTGEFRDAVRGRLADLEATGWVFDGNYHAVKDLILPKADSVVWLRLPWLVVYPRLVKRTMVRMFTGELLWGVNRESFRLAFLDTDSILLWGIRNWRPGLARTGRAFEEIPNTARVFTIRSPRQLRAFIRRLESGGA